MTGRYPQRFGYGCDTPYEPNNAILGRPMLVEKTL